MNWPQNKETATRACICFFVSVLFAAGGYIYFAFDPWSESVGHVIGSGCVSAWLSFIVWAFFWTIGYIEQSVNKDTRPCSMKS